ncbi:hypothetical protein ACP275_07G006400 [Erythranthe tilingii]
MQNFQSMSNNIGCVVGSCDGLICLAVGVKDLILWNPCTRIRKNLPDFGVEIIRGSYFIYGFGFDKSSDDYKVVGFFNSDDDLFFNSHVVVKVYSLKNDRWKTIEGFNGRWSIDDPATFAYGKLHWTAYCETEKESAWNILYLDLETEEYGVLEVPNCVNEKGCSCSMLEESEGCLYALCDYRDSADVWIVGDCDGLGKATWTKVVSVSYVDRLLKSTCKTAFCVLKNDEVLLLCGSTVVVFDVEDRSIRYPEIRNHNQFSTAITYFETLVSPLE